MRWLRVRSWLAALTGCVVCGAACGSDTVIGSVSGTRFSGGDGTFGGVGLTYEHGIGSAGFLFTASRTDFPIGSLTEFDVDAFKTLSPQLTLTAGASLGDASTPGRSDTLYKARLSADSQLGAWTLHAGYQYIALDLIHGNLVSSTVEYRTFPALGVKIGGGYHLGGTVADRYGQTEINWYGAGVERIYGGVVVGRTGYDPASLGETAVVERLFQLYAGAAIPIRRAVLTLGLDSLSLESSARQTLRIGLTEPINP
jgi:hypothetical protein